MQNKTGGKFSENWKKIDISDVIEGIYIWQNL